MSPERLDQHLCKFLTSHLPKAEGLRELVLTVECEAKREERERCAKESEKVEEHRAARAIRAMED